MDRSKADRIISQYHEAIFVCQNGSYDDEDNKKSKSTAIPAPQVQSRVHCMAALDTPYTASVVSPTTSQRVTVGSLNFYKNLLVWWNISDCPQFHTTSHYKRQLPD